MLCYLEKEVSEGDESRSVLRFGAPALQHHVVDVLRTVLWFTQPLGLHVHLVEDLRMDTQTQNTDYYQQNLSNWERLQLFFIQWKSYFFLIQNMNLN